MTPSGEIKDLNKSAYHLLRRAWQFAGDLYAQEVGAEGLTHRQFTVLLAVDQNEGASQTDLVSITGIDRSTLADLVSRLIKRGYLQRRRTKEDARANSIKLTAAGRRSLKSAQPGALSADKKLLKVLPTDQRKEFVTALMKISDALEEAEEEIMSNGAFHGNGPTPKRRRGKD
ncbi:MAG: MarR family winged helix-turn-helix transcriptional regulator [Hyphomicrobiales bacterium]